jgi:hypothetical protein
MKPIFKRMQRAIVLDQTLFEEVVADPSVQGQSVWVVAIYAMTTAFGSFSMIGGGAVNIGLITTILTWYIWAFSVFYFGTRFLGPMPEGADRKTIMRVVAFASAPGVIRLLGVIPKITMIILAVSSIWILIAAVMGLKKVFTQTTTAKITAICVGTWFAASLFQAILLVVLLAVFGVTEPSR